MLFISKDKMYSDLGGKLLSYPGYLVHYWFIGDFGSSR